MKIKFFFLIMLSAHSLVAHAELDLPTKYTRLLPYVQQAPDQGRTGTCLYIASTGAMELILNRKNGITFPKPYGPYDLSESFLISQEPHPDAKDKLFIEKAILRFNWGYAITARDWEFDSWNGTGPDRTVWDPRDWSNMTKVDLPKVTTIPLFSKGDRWATGVLNDSHIEKIKRALWRYKSPVLAGYKDNNYWHVVMIVGYDDHLPGNCYQIPEDVCREDSGSFYVRDSFGLSIEVRDYDWFRLMGNHGIVVKEVK